MSTEHEPLLLIVSSPSGAGKTTLTNALRQRIAGIHFSVSHTTRQPRANEQNGREYHFVNKAEFQDAILAEQFLEWAHVHDNLYGTSKAELERNRSNRAVLFDVDHQGARQIKSVCRDAVGIFILPPSLGTLLERLRGRASETDEAVQRRYQVAREEIAHYAEFDYVIVNDDLKEAEEQLVAIFRAEECRRGRQARLAEALLSEGRGFGGRLPPTLP